MPTPAEFAARHPHAGRNQLARFMGLPRDAAELDAAWAEVERRRKQDRDDEARRRREAAAVEETAAARPLTAEEIGERDRMVAELAALGQGDSRDWINEEAWDTARALGMIEAALRQARAEADEAAAGRLYAEASERERVERGIATPADIVDLLAEILAAEFGRPQRSGISEAAYWDIGGKKLRVAAHAQRPTYAAMNGWADFGVVIGEIDGEAHMNLNASLSVAEIEAAAAKIIARIDRAGWRAAVGNRS